MGCGKHTTLWLIDVGIASSAPRSENEVSF
jgi:hypothetical protein